MITWINPRPTFDRSTMSGPPMAGYSRRRHRFFHNHRQSSSRCRRLPSYVATSSKGRRLRRRPTPAHSRPVPSPAGGADAPSSATAAIALHGPPWRVASGPRASCAVRSGSTCHRGSGSQGPGLALRLLSGRGPCQRDRRTCQGLGTRRQAGAWRVAAWVYCARLCHSDFGRRPGRGGPARAAGGDLGGSQQDQPTPTGSRARGGPRFRISGRFAGRLARPSCGCSIWRSTMARSVCGRSGRRRGVPRRSRRPETATTRLARRLRTTRIRRRRTR